jgi:CCR4-NOT transcriptional regulation complex NOT5 subunit
MTAVEWLQMKMATSQTEEMVENINVWFAKAKKIEKKIIAQAFEDGDYNYFYSKKTGREFENGLEYYNEKFKSE